MADLRRRLILSVIYEKAADEEREALARAAEFAGLKRWAEAEALSVIYEKAADEERKALAKAAEWAGLKRWAEAKAEETKRPHLYSIPGGAA